MIIWGSQQIMGLFDAAVSAAAGDPHFVGFDGERFDYHGEVGSCYLIYDDKELRIEALFSEPDLNFAPHMAGMTYMTKLNINGHEISPFDLDPYSEEEIQTKTGMARGLPEGVNFVVGRVFGMKILNFSKGQLIITSMDSAGLHLNIAFILKTKYYETMGILGQTLLPKDRRQSNDMFKIGKRHTNKRGNLFSRR